MIYIKEHQSQPGKVETAISLPKRDCILGDFKYLYKKVNKIPPEWNSGWQQHFSRTERIPLKAYIGCQPVLQFYPLL